MKTRLFRRNNNMSNPTPALPQGEGANSPSFGGGWGKAVLSRVAYLSCLLLLLPVAGIAQNGVILSALSGSAGTLTFNVRWANNSTMPAVWSDSVWVFVDYNDEGVMKRLPLITSGATLTATSAPGKGKVIPATDNTSGVWVVGSARTDGSFSATVQLLTTTTTAAGACVYASNYPPAGKYESGSLITFTGTPEYELYLSDGSTYTLPCESPCTYEVPNGLTLLSFIDKTGAPGTFTQPPTPPDPIPDLLTAWRCGSGTVTLSASSAGAVIDWYKTAAGDAPLWSASNTFITPPLTTNTTYYAEARYEDTGQTSSRVPVTATIKIYEGEIVGEEI